MIAKPAKNKVLSYLSVCRIIAFSGARRSLGAGAMERLHQLAMHSGAWHESAPRPRYHPNPLGSGPNHRTLSPDQRGPTPSPRTLAHHAEGGFFAATIMHERRSCARVHRPTFSGKRRASAAHRHSPSLGPDPLARSRRPAAAGCERVALTPPRDSMTVKHEPTAYAAQAPSGQSIPTCTLLKSRSSCDPPCRQVIPVGRPAMRISCPSAITPPAACSTMKR